MKNPNARNTDPWTSHAAALANPQGKQKDSQKVWAVFVNEKRPLADYMLEDILGGPRNGKWRKRRSDLYRDGWLIGVGNTVCPYTEEKQTLWAIDYTKKKFQTPLYRT